jgi:hypothetical protein
VHQAARIVPEATSMSACEQAFPAAIAADPVTLPPAPSSLRMRLPEGPVPRRFELPMQQRRETAVSQAV